MLENKKFVFCHDGGPYGDATSSYRIFPKQKNLTLKDLVELILADSREWGEIKLFPIPYDKREVETILYDHGKLIRNSDAYNCYKDYRIKDVPFHAQGGWSVMDYVLEIHKP